MAGKHVFMEENSLLLPYITDFTKGLWAIRPKPFPDEILSSWLVRLAARNSLKLHTFCRIMFSRDRHIWNRDIDKLADPEILKILARGTGATEEQTRQTTLRAYEGWIYSAHNPYGNTKWILFSCRCRNLGALVSKASGFNTVPVPPRHVEIEHLNVAERRLLLLQAHWLLDEWPHRFVRLCKDNQIWSAWILKDMPEAPFWFSDVIHKELYVRHAPYDPRHRFDS